MANKVNRLMHQHFGAKLSQPVSVEHALRRNAICEQVLAAQQARLVVFTAPAGYGKTVSMAQVAEDMAAAGILPVWLTLDASDNDPERLLLSLDIATRPLVSDRPGAERDPHPADRFIDSFFPAGCPYALFLDDFEQINDPSALKLVREIARSTPAHGRLIIASRTVPAIGLARFKASGSLLQIDATGLQFSEQEMVQFLGKSGKARLGQWELLELYRKTEGWPAAIRLASTILDSGADAEGFVQKFSGSQTEISAYLAEEILATQPPEIRRFMLRTSLFQSLDAALCDAIFHQEGSARIIDGLIQAGMPISKAGDAEIYRYHSLFRSYLKGRLAIEHPQEAQDLHRKAMQWYQSQGRMVVAIDHAIACARFGDAIAFLNEAGFALLGQGRVRLLSRWFDSLPADAMSAAPRLQIVRAWAACFTAGPRAAEDILQRYGLDASDDAQTRSDAACMRPMMHAMLDDFHAAHEAGVAAADMFATASRYTQEVFNVCMAHVYASLGLFDKARQQLDLTDDHPQRESAVFSAMYSEGIRGMMDLQENNFRTAKARFEIAVRTRRKGEVFSSNGNAWAGVLHAYTYYEVNDLDNAARLLRVYLPFVCDAALPEHLITAFTLLSRVSFEEGDVDDAYRLLVELEAAGKRNGLRRVIAGARLERARLFLRQGNGASAAIQLADLQDKETWQRVKELRLIASDLDTLEIARIRLLIHERKPNEALALLQTEIADAEQRARKRRLLTLRLLEAAALLVAGDERRSRATMRGTLMKCAREGYMRLIIDEGVFVAQAARAYAVPAMDGKLGRSDPVFGAYLNRLLDALPPCPDPSETDARGALQALTLKEIDILGLVSEGYSNARLAYRLSVSDSTIRTHLRNINAKLCATSRGDAVAKGRKLGLIA